MFSFNSKPPSLTPDEQTKVWRDELKTQMRGFDRQVREISREEEKAKREFAAFAKKGGDPKLLHMIAKNIITARKSADRLTSMRAQLNSVSMQLAEQNALARVSGVLQRSTEIQKSMAILVKAPEVAAVARQMAAEMTKAGMMSEMMDDTFATMEPEGLDEEADEEVARVMAELTGGLLKKAGVATSVLPPGARAGAGTVAAAAPAARVAVPAGLSDVEARLAQL